MRHRDPCPAELLGVGPGASRAELRRAWRRLALETHPDQGGDRAAFEQARQAFLRLDRAIGGSAGTPPIVVVRRMRPPALALRWWRRRRHRRRWPRVL